MKNGFLILFLGLFFLGGSQTFATQLSGTVSINPSGTASGTVFKNYSSLITYLTSTGVRSDGGPSNAAPFGLSGNLTVNVVSATITEKVTIPSSTAATNPLTGLGTYKMTFLGASRTGSILQYATTSVTGDNYVVRLDGADNVTFQNMTIRASSTVTTSTANLVIHGYGISTNPCNDISIINCNITGVAAAATSYSAPVVFNGSTSYLSPTTGGYGSRITMQGNSISGGYYGVIVRGTGSTTSSYRDVTITSNTLSNSYYYAAYLYYATNMNFSQNNVSQTASALSYSYGTYVYYCNGWLDATSTNGSKTVIRNNIFSNIGAYGLYVFSSNGQSTTTPNEVTGNVMLGNYRNTGSYYYPLYFSSVSNTNIAHNTAAINYSYASNSYGVFYMTSGTNNKVYNNTFIGNGASNAMYLGTTNTGSTVSNNNLFNWTDNSATAQMVSIAGTAYNKSQLEANSIPQVSNANISVNQGWANLTNLAGNNGCALGAPLATAGVTVPSVDVNGVTRDLTNPTIGAYQINPLQSTYNLSHVTAVNQNNFAGPVFDTVSIFTISAYLLRGNIPQSSRYVATLYQNNVALSTENFQGGSQLYCSTDTLTFQYQPTISSGSVTFRVEIDSINGRNLDSISFSIQNSTVGVGIKQKAIIDKSVNYFSSLPIFLSANTPEPGNSGIWRRISIVPGTLIDSTLPSAMFSGARGSFHSVSYTISNNIASHTDTFEFYIANCPSGFASDSLMECDTVTTLDPGGASTYSWSTGDTTSTLRVNQSGWYSVVLISDSCVLTDSIYVQLKGKLQNQYVLDTLETCPGLGLNLWGTNYSPIVSQMGNASNRFQYLADTGHFQKVFINQWGCDSTISLNVLPLKFQEVRLDTHACSLDANFFFQGNMYPPGTDTIYVKNNNDCTQYFKVGVQWDGKNTQSATSLTTCQNTITLKPNPQSPFENVEFFVSSNGDTLLASDTVSTFIFSVPGNYSINRPYRYRNSSNCSAQQFIELVKEEVIIPSDTTICFGIPVQIVGNATKNWNTYAWSNGDTGSVTTPIIQVSGTLLKLTVSDGLETCTDSIQINLHSKQTNIPFDTTVQMNKPYSLDVSQYQNSPAQSFSWSNGEQTSLSRIYQAGWNSVTSVFSNGCSETDSVFVIFNDGISGTSKEGRINYQAQLGFNQSVKANRNVSLRFSIQHGSTTDFSETQTLTTDSKGLIHTLIGNGQPIMGSLNDIPWEDGQIRMLQVEVDTTGQNQWISLGSSRLVSVPYAEYARTSGDGSRNVFAIFDSNGQKLGGSGAVVLPKGNGVYEIGYEKSFQNEPVISIEMVGSGTYSKRIIQSDAQKCQIEIGGNPDKIHVTIHGK